VRLRDGRFATVTEVEGPPRTLQYPAGKNWISSRGNVAESRSRRHEAVGFMTIAPRGNTRTRRNRPAARHCASGQPV